MWKRAQHSASHLHEKWLRREPGLCNESRGLQRGGGGMRQYQWNDRGYADGAEHQPPEW